MRGRAVGPRSTGSSRTRPACSLLPGLGSETARGLALLASGGSCSGRSWAVLLAQVLPVSSASAGSCVALPRLCVEHQPDPAGPAVPPPLGMDWSQSPLGFQRGSTPQRVAGLEGWGSTAHDGETLLGAGPHLPIPAPEPSHSTDASGVSEGPLLNSAPWSLLEQDVVMTSLTLRFPHWLLQPSVGPKCGYLVTPTSAPHGGQHPMCSLL